MKSNNKRSSYAAKRGPSSSSGQNGGRRSYGGGFSKNSGAKKSFGFAPRAEGGERREGYSASGSFGPRSENRSYGNNSGSERGGYGAKKSYGFSPRSESSESSGSYGYSKNKRSYGKSKFGSNSGGGYSSARRGGFWNKGGNSGRKRGDYKTKINESMFVKRAEPFAKIEDVETKHEFKDFGFDSVLLKNIVEKGYTKPTPIQDQVIEELLKGRDILGLANTGTGKTAAFALPLIDKIIKNPKNRVLIMAPTRELATQIRQEIRSFTWGLKVYVSLAIGGNFIRRQIADIRRDPHIIVGTPGRIKDLGERTVIDFSKFNIVVLDEVDRMLDMGFVEEIKDILSKIPNERQSLFFSATVNKKVSILIDGFLKDAVKVSVKTEDTSSHVEQDVIRASRSEKLGVLTSLLKREEYKKVLIFAATKSYVDSIERSLREKGLAVAALHGDKKQGKRQSILQSFKSGEVNILVATDVAARGLDVADITHVINYDQPNNYDDYIHRIGRTGRGNSKGYALTFIDQKSR